jgi:hypothetical protein
MPPLAFSSHFQLALAPCSEPGKWLYELNTGVCTRPRLTLVPTGVTNPVASLLSKAPRTAVFQPS